MSRSARSGVLALALLTIAGLTVAQAGVIQKGGIRVTLLAQIKPFKLPRDKPAPIAVFVSGHVATPSGAIPPQLRKMTIRVNRHGLLRSRGLGTCALRQVKTASTERALSGCGNALVGSGRFWATIVLPDQRPYPTRGDLTIFNGMVADRPVLFAHIYTKNPFSSSFVITFSIKRIDQGPYGTELSASLPEALGSWGFVDRIKLTLKREYQFQGRQRSFFNAACPAPRGTRTTSFPLALASFYFAAHKPISLGVQKSCRVSE